MSSNSCLFLESEPNFLGFCFQSLWRDFSKFDHPSKEQETIEISNQIPRKKCAALRRVNFSSMSQNESAAMAAPQGPCYLSQQLFVFFFSRRSEMNFEDGHAWCSHWLQRYDITTLLRKLQAQAQSIKTLPTLTTYHIQQGCHISCCLSGRCVDFNVWWLHMATFELQEHETAAAQTRGFKIQNLDDPINWW